MKKVHRKRFFIKLSQNTWLTYIHIMNSKQALLNGLAIKIVPKSMNANLRNHLENDFFQVDELCIFWKKYEKCEES